MKPYAIICAALITADQLVKQVLPTPYWGWDPRGSSIVSVGLGIVAAGLLIAYEPVRLGGTIMLAGLLSNSLSAAHGSVANPFVVGEVAFNLADLLLLVGLTVILCSCPNVFRDIRSRRKGWTW